MTLTSTLHLEGKFGVSPAPSGRLLKLKPANHRDIIRLCEPETSNFVHYKAFTEVGGLGDVSNFAVLGDRGGASERWLLDIQPVGLTPLHTPGAIKNKLINQTSEAVKVNWYSGSKIVFGYCAPGCSVNKPQSMRVKTNPDGSLKISRFKTAGYANGEWPEYSDFVEPDGVTKADMLRPVSELMEEGKVLYWFQHFGTLDSVNRGLGQLSDLLCPMWDHGSFPVNHGKPYFSLEYFS